MGRILKFIMYLLIIVMVFIGVSYWRGGDWIRYAGTIIYRSSEEAAKISDNIYNCRKRFQDLCIKIKKTGIFKKDEDTDKGK